MKSQVQFVDYQRPQELTASKIRRFLLSKNLDACNIHGVASPYTNCKIGILLDDPKTQPRKYWLGFIKKRALREFAGIICCDDSSTDNQTIIFELYGRKHVEWAKNLAYEMALILDAEIIVKLMCEHPKVETLFESYSSY